MNAFARLRAFDINRRLFWRPLEKPYAFQRFETDVPSAKQMDQERAAWMDRGLTVRPAQDCQRRQTERLGRARLGQS